MVASTIIRQPSFSADISDAWVAAYLPLYFNVLGDSIVPPDQPMYCDIYLGDVPTGINFYKTISSYSISSVGGTNSIFEFNIQDALQEWIQTYLPETASTNAGILPAYINTKPFTYAACYVKFRGSTIASGILTPDPVIPIQGTATTPPVAGTGLQSNPFFVLNATIYPNSLVAQYNMSSSLLRQLQYLQPSPVGDTQVYPLTNLPPNFLVGPSPSFTPLVTNPTLCPDVYAGDSGLLPILIQHFVTSGILSRTARNCTLHLQYWFGAPSPSNVAVADVVIVASQLLIDGPYYLPYGMKEIADLVPSLIPILTNVNNDAYYVLYLNDDDAGKIAFTSPIFHAKNTGVEEYRLWFQNYYGMFEQVSFVRNTLSVSTTSSNQFKPYALDSHDVFNNLSQANVINGGKKRFNIREETEIGLTATFSEALMPWIEELMLSPYCLRDMPRNNVAYVHNFIFYNLNSYIVVDGSYKIKKTVIEGRINYEVTIKIKPSQEIVTLRN